jgi:hypothetical protein
MDGFTGNSFGSIGTTDQDQPFEKGEINTLTMTGEIPRDDGGNIILPDDPEYLLLSIRSNPGNIGFIPGDKLTPEMIQVSLESPKDRFNAINEARDKYGLQKLQEAEYFQSAGPHARIESPAEAFNEIVAPALQKTRLSTEVVHAITATLLESFQETPEGLLETALEKVENLKNQKADERAPPVPPTATNVGETTNDFGQLALDAVQLGAKEDDNQLPPDDEHPETEQPTETTPSHSGSGDPPNQPHANTQPSAAHSTLLGVVPKIGAVVNEPPNQETEPKPSTPGGPPNPDASLTVPVETNEAPNATPDQTQTQASTESEAAKKEPEPLPPCPDGASDWLRGLHSALGEMKENHDLRLAQDRAKRGLTKQEQKKPEDEEEAKRQYQGGGGGGGGRSFLSFNRENSAQKQGRRAARRQARQENHEAIAEINEKLVQKSLRNTFTLSSQVEADRLALSEKMQVLNATLSNDPEAQKYLSKVDDFAAAKGMTRGELFDKMHAGEMPGFAQGARELAQRPDLRPLFADADVLAGNLAKNTNSLCESLDSLKKKGVDVSHLKDHFDRMENRIQDARIPDPESKQRLDKLNKAMQEQMKKIMEAITKLVQKVLNSIRGRFGG